MSEATETLLSSVDEAIQPFILSRLVPHGVIEEKMAHNASEQMACLRSRYYSWTGASVPEPPRDANWLKSQLVFAMGNSVEDQLGRLLNAAGMLPSLNRAQVRLRSKKYLISGSIDYLALIDGKDVPIECKSCRQEAYYSSQGQFCVNCGEKVWSNAKGCKCCGLTPARTEHRVLKRKYDMLPSEDHYAQIQSYLNIPKPHFDYGYLFYYNKNTSETTWHKVLRDPPFFARMIARNTVLQGYLDAGNLPPRDFEAVVNSCGEATEGSDWHCRYCKFFQLCYREEVDAALQEQSHRALALLVEAEEKVR